MLLNKVLFNVKVRKNDTKMLCFVHTLADNHTHSKYTIIFSLTIQFLNTFIKPKLLLNKCICHKEKEKAWLNTIKYKNACNCVLSISKQNLLSCITFLT